MKPFMVYISENLVCTNLSDYMKSYPIIELHESDYFADEMLVNPLYDLNTKLPHNWFGIIMDAFLPLKPKYRQVLDKYKTKYFGKYTISIQIRVPIATGIPSLPNDFVGAPPMGDKELYYQAAEELSQQLDIPYNEIVWFLATQDEEILNWFKSTRPGPVIWYESPKTVAFEMGQGAIPGKVAATITSYLMSESDDIIVTESSSYGGVSAARGGLRALFCVSYQICLRRMRAVPVGWYGGVIHKIPCLQSLNTPIKLHAPDQSHRLFSLMWHQLEQDGKNKLDWRNK